jgi:hypothetical protein
MNTYSPLAIKPNGFSSLHSPESQLGPFKPPPVKRAATHREEK